MDEQLPPAHPHPGARLLAGEADDDREADAERGPLRRCLVTRERGGRERMLRFVLGPDRMVVPDLLAKLPGRGMWLSPRADVVEAAVKKGMFARAARGPVILPPDLLSLIRDGLTRRVIDLLGLARRAGQATAGFEKARAMVVRGQAGLVIQALDGSEEECRRLLSGAGALPVVRPLMGLQLGTAFGRDHVVHVAVAPGSLAERLEGESFRLCSLAAPGSVLEKAANGETFGTKSVPRRRRAISDRTVE